MNRLNAIRDRWIDDDFGIAHPIIEEELTSDIKYLLDKTDKLEEIKSEIAERIRNANNLDEHDLVFELENILEMFD